MTSQDDEKEQSISASSLEKPRRWRNLLMLTLLLVFVAAVYYTSFTHIGEEADPVPVESQHEG